VQICRLLKDRDLTQAKAAKLLGTIQAQVSAIMRCRPVSVSVGRLMNDRKQEKRQEIDCRKPGLTL
jgi:predicted XRE-type DNA-binding protein